MTETEWCMIVPNPKNPKHWIWLHCKARNKSDARSIFKKKLKVKRLFPGACIQINYDPPSEEYLKEVEGYLNG